MGFYTKFSNLVCLGIIAHVFLYFFFLFSFVSWSAKNEIFILHIYLIQLLKYILWPPLLFLAWSPSLVFCTQSSTHVSFWNYMNRLAVFESHSILLRVSTKNPKEASVMPCLIPESCAWAHKTQNKLVFY